MGRSYPGRLLPTRGVRPRVSVALSLRSFVEAVQLSEPALRACLGSIADSTGNVVVLFYSTATRLLASPFERPGYKRGQRPSDDRLRRRLMGRRRPFQYNLGPTESRDRAAYNRVRRACDCCQNPMPDTRR